MFLIYLIFETGSSYTAHTGPFIRKEKYHLPELYGMMNSEFMRKETGYAYPVHSPESKDDAGVPVNIRLINSHLFLDFFLLIFKFRLGDRASDCPKASCLSEVYFLYAL